MANGEWRMVRPSTCVSLIQSNPRGCKLQTRTHGENMAEAAAREAGPASVSKLIGTGPLVDQPTCDFGRAVDLLKGYLSEDRLSRMQDVLDERTRSTTLVFENPANPNNVRGMGCDNVVGRKKAWQSCLLRVCWATRSSARMVQSLYRVPSQSLPSLPSGKG